MLELLAPAGDISSFNAAIAYGADAIYLGLSDFNARRRAENFSADNLRQYIERAHFFGVKVYITLNTLVKDCEMAALLSLARAAVEAKADAFIVQDLGVAARLKEAFPNVRLHASTQLGVHNLYGALQAEKLGFRRVVLSREVKLEDIRDIRNNTDLEIECFAQGALCVAFSGNCYLSAAEQNASGNRGLCKQLCRLPYRASVGGVNKEGYLLSAKDICLASSLKELADAGVTSFKIEGRMRREGYVAGVVDVYRRIIDGVNDGAKLSQRDREELQIAYCRGDGYLERAYLDRGTPSVIDSVHNNHTGLEIGVVKDVKPFKADLYRVTLTSEYPLGVGDGLKLLDGEGKEAASVGLGDIKPCGKDAYSFVTKTKLQAGWTVRLIFSAEKGREIAAKRRVVYIDLEVEAVSGKPLAIAAYCDVDGRCVSAVESGDICERARTSPLTEEDLRSQASKTADSGFEVRECRVRTDGVFVAKSAINALRRTVIERLKANVIAERERDSVAVDERAYGRLLKEKTAVTSGVKLRFVREYDMEKCYSENDRIVLCPSEYNVKNVEKMLKLPGVQARSVALQLPVIANGRDILKIEELLAAMPDIRTLVSENIYGLHFVDSGYEVICGVGHNILNGASAKTYVEMGAAAVIPSLESERSESVYSDELPLMTFAHCPYKTVFGCDCNHCACKEPMTISREGREYTVRRVRVSQCYFGLYAKRR